MHQQTLFITDNARPAQPAKSPKPPILRSPIRWFGGKGNMVAKLLRFVPEHHIYCEVFGGGASLLFRKTPAPVEVYNDLDEGLVNLFRVIRDREQFEEFHRLVSLTPYSRAEYYHCRETWRDETDPVKRAHKWFVVARQGFGGKVWQGWGFTVTATHRGMSSAVSKYVTTNDNLPRIHDRLMRVQIECQDFRKVIPTYDTGQTFFYLDPPYVASTRKSGGYTHEMTDEDHADLVDLIREAKGMVLLSGYASELYESLGWKRVDFETACHAAGKTRNSKLQGKGSALKHAKRVESLWLNPALEKALDNN